MVLRTAVRGLTRTCLLLLLGLTSLPAAAQAAPYQRDMASQANITFVGRGANDQTGTRIGAAGDVNSDGRPDLFLAAPHSSASGPFRGAAYVIFGQPTNTNIDLSQPLGTRGYRIDGGADYDYLGSNVENAGDVSGDGRPDLLIAADGRDYGGRNSAGSAYVIYGKASTTAVNAAALGTGGYEIGGATANAAISSVANAGDVNGDGIRDQLIAAEDSGAAGRAGAGSAWVVFGKRNQAAIDLASLGANGFAIAGSAASAKLGSALSGAGDVNGDGRDDVLVGENGGAFASRSGAGSVYVIYGRTATTTLDAAALPAASGYRIGGAATSDGLGRTVANAGDVNGDGVPDQLVGAPGAAFNGRAGAGMAYVVSGRRPALGTVDLAAPGAYLNAVGGAASADHAGLRVASLGDVNGDGRSDSLITASDATFAGRAAAGNAYVVYGRVASVFPTDLADLDTQGYVIGGAAAGDGLGFESGASAGDFNGDGVVDIAVGAWRASPAGRTQAGSAYIVYSDPAPPSSTLSVTPIGGAQRQRYDAASKTLLYSSAGPGSFRIDTSPTDTGPNASGVFNVTYPPIATTGFTGGGTPATASPWSSTAYSFDSSNSTAPAPITTTVQDGKGNRSVEQLSFVRDSAGPVTAFESPAGGTGIRNGQSLAITATDSAAGVESVAFRYCAGTSCDFATATPIGGSVTAAPFSRTWDGQPADGTYTVIARATDTLSNVTDVSRTVTIANAAATPTRPERPRRTSASTGDPAMPSSAANPVLVRTKAIRLSRRGTARIRLRCTTSERCRGRLTIFAYVRVKPKRRAGRRATSSAAKPRKRKIVLSRKRFDIAGAKTTTVKVQISRRARRRILRKNRARCRISTTVGGRTTTRAIQIKGPKPRSTRRR